MQCHADMLTVSLSDELMVGGLQRSLHRLDLREIYDAVKSVIVHRKKNTVLPPSHHVFKFMRAFPKKFSAYRLCCTWYKYNNGFKCPLVILW